MTTHLIDPVQSLELARWFVRAMRKPALRTLREFAEEEIIVPDGPFAGERFRCDVQPFARLYFDAVDSGNWHRFAAVGPTQTGKTFCCCVIPLMYHLFELQDTVVYGVPDLNMVQDKWEKDILPAITASRYADMLPTRGSGARGGRVGQSVTFRNGATLRFMTGGGGDKSRAAFTARVLIVTETDGMDESGDASREADKISQMEGRLRAHDEDKRVYLECTASISAGRIWREYESGTKSRIMQKCPECGEFVHLGRQHLVGWQNCDNILDAREQSAYACSACGVLWTEEERRQAAGDSILIHKGQEIDRDGNVTGDMPRTETLGFRWSAPDNMFNSAGTIGVDEWTGARDENEDNAEKKLCQFVWALPFDPDIQPMANLSTAGIITRLRPDRQGAIPSDTEAVTVALDLGKFLAHWTAIAWLPNDTPHVLDYGVQEVATQALVHEEDALRVALIEWHAQMQRQWGEAITAGLIDSGWHPEIVYEFCKEKGDLWLPAKGYGASLTRAGNYRGPTKKSKGVIYIGDGIHVTRLPAIRIKVAHLNSDHWKSYVHACLETPLDQPGALSLYHVEKMKEHHAFAKHLTAEKQVIEFVPGKGEILRWEQERKANHWLDSTYMACGAREYGEWLKTRRRGRSATPRQAGRRPQDTQPPRPRRNGRILS